MKEAVSHSMSDITIVVVPRESFSLFPQVVENIYTSTKCKFNMIIMEGCSPPEIRQELLDLSASKQDCQVVLSNEWRYPHEFVNEAIALLETEFVLFIDNDIEVQPGAIEALVDCARKHQVACVHPLYLGTSLDAPELILHCGKGEIVQQQKSGTCVMKTRMDGKEEPLEDYSVTAATSSDFFEWHCVLFRRDLLERVGPLAPLTVNSHIDYSLEISKQGETIMVEPRAVVAYDKKRLPQLTGTDCEFLLHRWNLPQVELSLELFRKKWGLTESSTQRKMEWATTRIEELRQAFAAATSN